MDQGERLQVEGRQTDRRTGTAAIDMPRHVRVVHLYLKSGTRRRILQTIKPAEARIPALLNVDADPVRRRQTLPP